MERLSCAALTLPPYPSPVPPWRRQLSIVSALSLYELITYRSDLFATTAALCEHGAFAPSAFATVHGAGFDAGSVPVDQALHF